MTIDEAISTLDDCVKNLSVGRWEEVKCVLGELRRLRIAPRNRTAGNDQGWNLWHLAHSLLRQDKFLWHRLSAMPFNQRLHAKTIQAIEALAH